MFATAAPALRLLVRSTIALIIASIVLALGITVVTVAHAVWVGVGVVADEVLGQADECTAGSMLVDRCATLDTSRVVDLRPQTVAVQDAR